MQITSRRAWRAAWTLLAVAAIQLILGHLVSRTALATREATTVSELYDEALRTGGKTEEPTLWSLAGRAALIREKSIGLGLRASEDVDPSCPFIGVAKEEGARSAVGSHATRSSVQRSSLRVADSNTVVAAANLQAWWESTQLVGEVTGLVIEPITASSPDVCKPPRPNGCSCCMWGPGIGADTYNLFVMSNLSRPFLGYEFDCAQAGLISNAAQCCEPVSLLPGQAAGFLVQGESPAGRGPLGFDSSGNAIPIRLDCP